ncbi:MAG: LamG domain-containing protein [Verrucomicrobiota bacterium]
MQLARQMRLGMGGGAAQTKRFFAGSFQIIAISLAVLASWLSAATVFAQVGPGSALRFGSSNALVQIAPNASFNSYPFTVSAWFRTTNGSNIVQGIAGKYLDGTGNGWALLVQNGKLRGFHYRTLANRSVDATSVATVADGFWHHAAMTVDASGGKLFLDGVPVGVNSWIGAAGGTASTEPLLVGRYSHSIFPSLTGEIDEVTYWNRALATNEVNYLKHRQLNGNEEGLVGLWHCDEGSGLTTADATGHGYVGTLSSGPIWISSTAPLVFNSIAGTAVSLNGVNQNISVTHTADLNAFPLTLTAWVKTSRTNVVGDGIVTKYADSSLNGYSMHLSSGRLRAWYFRNGSNYAWDGGTGIDGGFVADGGWHHVAFVVNTNRGQLFVDGNPAGVANWVGTAGPTTSLTNLQIGQYGVNPGYSGFSGSIDEVTIWNRAFTTNEIQLQKNLLLTGSEPNLLAYWRFDENLGTTAADLTGLGHLATLNNAVLWTGSTAFLGDGNSAIHTALGAVQWTRRFAVQTITAQSGFAASAPFWIRRLDDFGAAGGNTSAQVNLQTALQATLAGAVPLSNDTTQFNFSLPPYNAAAPQASAGGIIQSPTLKIEPQPGTQLDSVNDAFQLSVTETFNVNSGSVLPADAFALAPVKLLHFNGHVFFGPIDTVLTNIANTPAPGTNTPPTHVASQLQISPGGAFLATAPGFKFGGGAAFNVNLGANGYVTNLNGSFSLANATQFFETNGIRYRLPGASLNAAGLTATSLEASFPAGFGLATSTNVRAMTPFAVKTNIVLGPDLLPTTPTVTFTAASYGSSQLYFAEETKPLFIGAPQIEWHIPQGEFYLTQADALRFVRQQEDDDLFAQQATLVVPLAAERISNDGYYHNVISTPGVPVYVRPDTNGAALLTMLATLRETEFRPHFPYLSTSVGGHVPVIGGALTISNDLIDTTASYLLLAGPVPVPYSRDCPPEGGCSSAPTIGGQVLSFTPPVGAHFGLSELGFTPDGGLVADGTIPPANLTWGFAGGTNYGQRTSDVQAGAYHVPGTFLRGDQTQLPDTQRAPALLATGWGHPTNSAYSERPGTLAYRDGFANYAGLNFRAPTQGRSFIAGMDTGFYPLTPRSKYYVRYGGVSGIHEAASFPANLALYGYAFTFQSYRLSYLDSANWESRTDGLIALPHPSAFNVEFQRMKFLCRGNLDSAQLPANIGAKHMAYWNTDLKPMSLQFKPSTGDPCSLTNRYLVLGVETKLPFIPQAFQAALAFKNNGNLANDLTAVEGVDSRFPVPANLSLQGSGGSFYPLNTAAEGYFNNWERPNRPAHGFYNLVGRVRVPFFRDVKVQLHITPTTADTAQVNIMGGWPAEEGSGVNRGWNVGAQNYFNTFKFDPAHDGWPAGMDVGNYYNPGDDTFHPRAQQNWIDVAFFDYPLTWNSVLREFSGYAPVPVLLPVIDVESRLKQLTPGKVDLDFAQDLNVQLPRVKALDFANNALNELNAPLDSLSSAIRAQLGATLNTSGLTSGFRSLQNVLSENPEGFFRPVIESALTDPANNAVDKIYSALAAELACGK